MPEPVSVISGLTLEQLAGYIEIARDVRRLNALWQYVRTNGWLQAEFPHPETGEQITFQDYLSERDEAIKCRARRCDD